METPPHGCVSSSSCVTCASVQTSRRNDVSFLLHVCPRLTAHYSFKVNKLWQLVSSKKAHGVCSWTWSELLTCHGILQIRWVSCIFNFGATPQDFFYPKPIDRWPPPPINAKMLPNSHLKWSRTQWVVWFYKISHVWVSSKCSTFSSSLQLLWFKLKVYFNFKS